MRKFFVVALGSAVALVGFAGAANATIVIDLIWADTGTSRIGDPDTSIMVDEFQTITLNVVMTAGPLGSDGGSVSVDYSAVLGKLAVIGTASVNGPEFPVSLSQPIDTGSRVNNITAACLCFASIGIGLDDGQSATLGTITFLKSAGLLNDEFEITVFNGEGDGISTREGTTTDVIYNSAFLINVPEPGALSLLILGLGGLGLMGRGRRS